MVEILFYIFNAFLLLKFYFIFLILIWEGGIFRLERVVRDLNSLADTTVKIK